MAGFWDRKLTQSHKELQALAGAIKKHEDEPAKMRKKIKRISRFYKSRLGEVARLDDSIYNVSEQPQGDADGDKGPEVEGDESSNRESDRTEP